MGFINLIDYHYELGHNIISYVSSSSVIMKVVEHFKLKNLPKPRIYTGDDKADDDDNKCHELIKREHFANINEEFIKHRIILCSPTVGAGIDFSLEHFDVAIDLYVSDNK